MADRGGLSQYHPSQPPCCQQQRATHQHPATAAPLRPLVFQALQLLGQRLLSGGQFGDRLQRIIKGQRQHRQALGQIGQVGLELLVHSAHAQLLVHPALHERLGGGPQVQVGVELAPQSLDLDQGLLQQHELGLHFHVEASGDFEQAQQKLVEVDVLEWSEQDGLAQAADDRLQIFHPRVGSHPAGCHMQFGYPPIIAVEEGIDVVGDVALVVKAQAADRMLGAAGLVERARIVMEKPFGTDLASAQSLNTRLHEVFNEEQIFRIDHFLGKEPAQNILAFRFANGLFEPIWNRNFIDHIQIDVPETLGLGQRVRFYETIGAFRDMVVTHLFQILAFVAMEAPTSLAPAPIGEEKNKVFRSLVPIQPSDVIRGQYTGYRQEEGVRPDSQTETFIALKCSIDNWRWAGVPFYLRTGKQLAEGQRIISIAFREPPKSMFPANSGVGAHGPDHLTFDLADQSKMSLSFYGKRPGPGMHLDKLSLQFAMHDTHLVGDVLEAYERLILDAMRGDRTLFTTAEGIERLWDVSTPLLEAPPPVRSYAPGSWGPNAIHQLIAPHAWRLPFERVWRAPNYTGS